MIVKRNLSVKGLFSLENSLIEGGPCSGPSSLGHSGECLQKKISLALEKLFCPALQR